MAGKTQKIGRNAKNGKFMPVKKAEKDKAHAIVETIKKKKQLKTRALPEMAEPLLFTDKLLKADCQIFHDIPGL